MFGFDDILGGVISGVFGLGGQEMTNQANAANAKELMAWNTVEAEKARAFDAKQGGIARNFNRIEASKSRMWQQMMSGTAHRREMYDLKKAGLNPILAVARPGASTPGGATASTSAVKGGQASGGQLARYESALAKGLNSAVETVRAKSAIEREKAETATAQETKRLTERSADNKLKEGTLIDAQVKETNARAAEALMSTARQSAEINDIQERVERTRTEAARNRQETKLGAARWLHEIAATAKTREERIGRGLENESHLLRMPGERIESEIDQSWAGEAARWLGRWNPFGSSASSILRAIK